MAAAEKLSEKSRLESLKKSVADLKENIAMVKEIEETLQNQRDELLYEKLKLPQLNLSTDEEILSNISHVISAEKGRDILKILHEIHEYDLEILELNDQIQGKNAEREMWAIKDAFYTATTPPGALDLTTQTNVFHWYNQLKKYRFSDIDGMSIENVYLRKNKKFDNPYHEELTFTANFKGTSAHVVIKSVSKLSKIDDDSKYAWEVEDCSVSSDLCTQTLKSRGQHLLRFRRPVRMFLEEILKCMSASVISYV